MCIDISIFKNVYRYINIGRINDSPYLHTRFLYFKMKKKHIKIPYPTSESNTGHQASQFDTSPSANETTERID